MADRSVRKLSNLSLGGSSSRVLNLQRIYERAKADPDYRKRPFFQGRRLNESIILKHRLRSDEVELFDMRRTIATKVIFPLDRRDLRAGGHFFFVGQRDYDAILRNAIGETAYAYDEDRRLLNVLDKSPSFDPFLLRETLRRENFRPAECYLHISATEMANMQAFVQQELGALALVHFTSGGAISSPAAQLARKMTSESALEDLEPLREALKFSHSQFADGVFAWRGMLYYKWCLSEIRQEIPIILDEIQRVNPRASAHPETMKRLNQSRRRICIQIVKTHRAAAALIEFYDAAFRSLVEEKRPTNFRTFLLEAPNLFVELGERIGSLTHIKSFWRFRFDRRGDFDVNVEELVDIFADFEAGLQIMSPTGTERRRNRIDLERDA